ncbi:MAG: hypothetical protein K0R34_4045, partial [Herbinix sp.]|nr:hypothetical protein [Herbinix sp.]
MSRKYISILLSVLILMMLCASCSKNNYKEKLDINKDDALQIGLSF